MISVRAISEIDQTQLASLSNILIAVVDQGASVGFLPPLDVETANGYWNGALAPNVVLLIAEEYGEIVGTAQLEMAKKVNGLHRAEVNKVLVHPDRQRRGIGRLLMNELESEARKQGRTLLHLDTREGDPSNPLYQSVGYQEAGRIPQWARSADGDLHPTVFYFKELS